MMVLAMANNRVEMIRKTFNESVSEIRMYEQNLKEVVPRPPSDEAGRAVEMTSMTFGESLAEIDRLLLVKRLGAKGQRKRV